MKCSNGGSDMCPKRHVVNGHLVSWGEGTVPLGAAAAGRPLPPSLPSICFEPKANCRRQRQSSSKREATFNLSSSLFHHSGFLMTGGGSKLRKGGGREKRHIALVPRAIANLCDQVVQDRRTFAAVAFRWIHSWSGESRAAGKAICDAAKGRKEGQRSKTKGRGKGRERGVIRSF